MVRQTSYKPWRGCDRSSDPHDSHGVPGFFGEVFFSIAGGWGRSGGLAEDSDTASGSGCQDLSGRLSIHVWSR